MTEHGAGPSDDEPSAPPLADETRKLLAAVQEWTQRALPAPPSGHGGPECQWCPLCQFASILRGERPEVAERVAEVGAALSAVFRALVESASGASGSSGGSVGGPSAGEPKSPPRPSPAPRVQRVRFDGDASDGEN